MTESPREAPAAGLHALLVEHSSDVCLILGPDGMVRYATQALTRVLGFEPEELCGRLLWELVHPQDGPYTRRLLAKSFEAAGQGPKMTFRIADRGGAWRVLEGLATNLRDRPEVRGLIVNLRDVTEHLWTQEALRRTNNMLEALSHAHAQFIQDVPKGVLFKELLDDVLALQGSEFGFIAEAPEGQPGRLELLAITNMARAAAGQAVGVSRELDGWEAARPVAAWLDGGVLRGGEATGGGRSLWCLPFHKGGVLIGVVALARLSEEGPPMLGQDLAPGLAACANLVEGYRAQERGRRMEAALLEAYQELQRLDAAKDEFVSTVSHELRTPLTAILNAASILQKPQAGALTDVQARFVGLLAEQANRLNRLVDDLLDLQKIETGNQSFRLEPLDVRGLVREVVGSYAHVLETRRLGLSLALGDEPLVARAEAETLGRVLLNLLSNAAKFTPEGGHVTVRAGREGAMVTLTVEDTGAGIPEADLERVFQKFARVDGSLTRQVGGTGLGLSICKQIIEQGHGGRIWATRPACGTALHVALPAC